MKEPILSVAILKAEEINFELYGDYYSSDEKQKINGKFIARIDESKIKILQIDKVINHSEEVLFFYSNLETDSFLVHDVEIGIQFHWQQKEN